MCWIVCLIIFSDMGVFLVLYIHNHIWYISYLCTLCANNATGSLSLHALTQVCVCLSVYVCLTFKWTRDVTGSVSEEFYSLAPPTVFSPIKSAITLGEESLPQAREPCIPPQVWALAPLVPTQLRSQMHGEHPSHQGMSRYVLVFPFASSSEMGLRSVKE